MPFLHKFQNHDFGNGFQTHNAILDVVPYEPQVLFIGTYNHGWSWNIADFYYGRDMYMWTVLANLFVYGQNQLIGARNVGNLNPTFHELFEICSKGKFVFADIVKGIAEQIPAVETGNKSVLVNDQYHWNSYQDSQLDEMGEAECLADNGAAIIRYVNDTPSLKHIYFTFKTGTWLNIKKNQIIQDLRGGVTIGNIISPSMNGFGKSFSPPFHRRLWDLAHCWVWNGLPHAIPVNRENYTHLNHQWLAEHGVDPNNF